MDASIHWMKRQKEGKRYAVLRWRLANGPRQQKALGYVSAKEAQALLDEQVARLRLAISSKSSVDVATVDDLIELYLAALEADQRGSPLYRHHEMLNATKIGRHLGTRKADSLTTADLHRLVELLRTSPAKGERGIKRTRSVTTVLSCFGRIVRHGRAIGRCERDLPQLPRRSLLHDARPARQLTEAELRRLVDAAAEIEPARARLLTFLAWCPRRPVAVFAIRARDCERVQAASPEVYIVRDKAGVGRGWCPLTPPAQKALIEQLEGRSLAPDDLVWLAPRGGAWTSPLLTAALKPVLRRSGLVDVRPYDLRKFGASLIYARTASLHLTARFTGHGDVRTLLTAYIREEAGAVARVAPTLTWGS